MPRMRFSQQTNLILCAFLILFNILLRFQVVPHEIGVDSFLIHIITNSLSEFGHANWVMHPLSLIGYYPLSEASSTPFLVSGIFQTTGLGMEPVIFIYSVFIGILSGFAAYLFAGAIVRDDLFKFLAAFGFSTSSAVLDLTTWTVGTRGLLVVMAPFIGYLLLKNRASFKYIIPIVIISFFLLATHRMFAYLIAPFASYVFLSILFRLKIYSTYFKIPLGFIPVATVAGFFAMFSLPFFFGKFLEVSRYSPVYESYSRYTGIFTLFAISGTIYLILKDNKSFEEWFLLLTLMFLTAFIYQQTYFKYFIPVFAIPVACIGFLNVAKLINKRKIALGIIFLFLIASFSFSAYYQFLHEYKIGFQERYIEDSTYHAGKWIKEYADDIGISNVQQFDYRIFATSENIKLITTSTMIDYIYRFISVNDSNFVKYPITSEDFWYNLGEFKSDPGEILWYNINMGVSPEKLNISYFVENVKAYGNIIWHHSNNPPSELLKFAKKEKNLVYSNGIVQVWNI